MKKNNVYIMAECAVLISLSTVLSMFRLFPLPLGGAVTPLSMLPVCMIPVRHGPKWGFASAFLYSLIQLLLGITTDGVLAWGLTPGMLLGCLGFDYLLAYTVLGFAGAFRHRGIGGVAAGFALAFSLRFASHFLSGYIIFTNLEQWALFGRVFESRPALYSAAYNACYMLPELVFTLLAVILLSRLPVVRAMLSPVRPGRN